MPKLCGADIELGNFIAGMDRIGGTGFEASHALLAEIKGLPVRPSSYFDGYWSTASAAPKADADARGESCGPKISSAYNPLDVSRRFLASNGGSAYIDLNHAELCLPEVVSAYDHVAAWHGMLRIARTALDSANEGRTASEKVHVLVNNSDGMGHSYGSHLNFLISRHTFDNILFRKAHYLQFLASFQVSSILLTGQGKVGSENGRPDTPYQISQRADFFETLHGVQTTYNRPLINARDETLCGELGNDDPAAPARWHVIFFDSALAHGSCLFRVGPTQLVLTLLELGHVNSKLILDDPLLALQLFSHDPTLKSRAALINGQHMTALELQCAFLNEVKRHAAQGVFIGIVPRFEEIIALWEDTLNKLVDNDLMALAPRLDWVLKLMAIERAMEHNHNIAWDSPQTKVIDHLYSSLDDDGLFRAYEARGFTEQLVTPERIAHFTGNPPSDTRAWTRAMLLRRAINDRVEVNTVDWDRITFRIKGRHNWPSYRTIALADPLGFTQAHAESIFEECTDFNDLLDGLESLTVGESSAHDQIAVN
jgi:proteasome accessory factor A